MVFSSVLMSRIFVNVFISEVMLIFAYHDGVVALLGEVFT